MTKKTLNEKRKVAAKFTQDGTNGFIEQHDIDNEEVYDLIKEGANEKYVRSLIGKVENILLNEYGEGENEESIFWHSEFVANTSQNSVEDSWNECINAIQRVYSKKYWNIEEGKLVEKVDSVPLPFIKLVESEFGKVDVEYGEWEDLRRWYFSIGDKEYYFRTLNINHTHITWTLYLIDDEGESESLKTGIFDYSSYI